MIKFDLTELTDPSYHNQYDLKCYNLNQLNCLIHHVIIDMI